MLYKSVIEMLDHLECSCIHLMSKISPASIYAIWLQYNFFPRLLHFI